MPDYNVSTVASEIKPPAVTSLGDMLNVARGAQAYRQAEQINPLQLEQQKTQTQTIQLENRIKNANNIVQGIQQLITKPDVSETDIVDMAGRINETNGGDERTMRQALMGLSNAKTPTERRAWLAQKLASTTGSLAQLEKLYPQGILPGQLPENAPSAQGAQQSAAPQQAQAPAELPEHTKPIPTPYPVRAAGQAFAPAPSEAADMTAGTAYRQKLVDRQSQLTTDRRNVDEVIKQAHELEKSLAPTSGILGSAYRHLATWAGDPTYIELSKNLAQTQLSNMKTLGLSTDADKTLVAAAQGDYTYPPEILMKIAARTKADMTNIDMQATAAEKFKNRFGDNNMKKFQQEWSKNADSKIFEVINLAKDTELTAEEKKKIANELMGKDPKQRAIFNEKYQNILKLQQTGSL